MAKLAEQAERYDEMVEYMKSVVQVKQTLELEERNLLSVAYKNVVGARRASLRVVGSILQKHEENSDFGRLPAIKSYKGQVIACSRIALGAAAGRAGARQCSSRGTWPNVILHDHAAITPLLVAGAARATLTGGAVGVDAGGVGA